MSSINVLNIINLNPSSKCKDMFQFEIVFECLSELKDDIEWKVIYIGSAEDDSQDQMLETVLIGPLNLGSMKFVLEANAPDFSKIQSNDILGVTAMLLTCSYNNQEFFRVGYYINNVYDNEEMNLNPPEVPQIDRILRNVLSEKPRITKFNIDWDGSVNIIPSYNNFMFNDKISSETIQKDFVDCQNNNITDNKEGMENLFISMQNKF